MPSPAAQPLHHYRTRFYARRVQESLTHRALSVLCSVLLLLLAIAGVVFFVLWLALRPHRPRFHVSNFSAPGLASGSATISFNVTDRNPNSNIGIYYEAMSCEVFYRERPIAAAPLLFPFYQPPKNTTLIKAELSGDQVSIGDDTRQQFNTDAAKGPVKFLLELRSPFRFRLSMYDTHRHHLHVNCVVLVGGDGYILPQSTGKRCSIYFA